MVLAPVSAAADGPAIDHAPVGCVVAEKFPRMDARIEPLFAVAKATLHFRSATGGPWYLVAMKAQDGAFEGVLPKPKKSLKAFAYYIEAADTAFATSRTPEYTAQVVDGPAACQGKKVAGALGSASILLEVPAGAPVVPVGFAPAGVAGTAAGTAAAVTGAAAGGGGIATTVLLVGGGVAAAGAAVAVAASHGGGSGSAGSGGGGGTRSAGYNVSFLPSPPGIDVSTCADQPLTWCCQNVHADSAGNFDETWAPSRPNTARITGRATDTTFTATLTCTNGATSGSLSATGSGGTYQGSFSFGASRGNITVQRSAP
jgi:hypothetical protein